MSDGEINEIAAVRVMKWKFKVMNGYKEDAFVINDGMDLKFYSEWNPTNDMNDAMKLFEEMVKDFCYSDATITYPYCVVAGYQVTEDVWEPHWSIKVEDDKLSRAITIAAILAKDDTP